MKIKSCETMPDEANYESTYSIKEHCGNGLFRRFCDPNPERTRMQQEK